MTSTRRGAPRDTRGPLDVARAIADRFMRMERRQTYMWSFGRRGVLDVYGVTGDQQYLDFYMRDVQHKPPVFDWHLYRATGDRQWIEGAAEQTERILTDGVRDRDGVVLDSNGRYTIDPFSGQFTMPIILGHVLNDHRLFDEAAHRMEAYRGYLEDPATGLWYSRWGHSLHPNRPNPGLWSRGNGWLTGAWGQAMHLWDPKHSAYEPILQQWRDYSSSIAAMQAPSGLFRQLLNRPDCFEEASGSGLFATGWAHGVLNGTLDARFIPIIWRTFCGLRALVDEQGNIHNVSTYAGGYNFEKQYYSCARFNDPHGDGLVMSGCAAVHRLIRERQVDTDDLDEPSESPVIVTERIPGLLSQDPPPRPDPEPRARPILERVLELEALPEHDLYGSTVLGLLHWYDFSKAEAALRHAADLFHGDGDRLPDIARWRVRAELAHRGVCGWPKGLAAFVDERLAAVPRDRAGVFLDEAGGYRIEPLYVWLPLLAQAGAASGEPRFFDQACTQLFGHQRWLEDPLTRFWYSAYGHGAHPRRVTPGLWALGNGYVVAGTVGLLERLPRDHDRYADVICLLRRLLDALCEALPVVTGWRQLIDRPDSFACSAATALLTYGFSSAIYHEWTLATYWAAAIGGVWSLGAMLDGAGAASLPTGGLDRIEDYQSHCSNNDPAVLGFILSGCACAALCQRAGLDHHVPDSRPGAR